MRFRFQGLFFLVIYLILSPMNIFSQTLNQRVERLENENQAIKEKVSLIEENDKNQTSSKSLSESDKNALNYLTAIQKRVQPFGDLAFRYQGLFYLKNVQNRGINYSQVDTEFSRPEVRVRFGLKGEVVDNLFYQVRLATGPTNFPSGAWPPWDGFSKKQNINVDRYFIDWNPNLLSPLHVLLGKFENPVKGTELVWDSDVGLPGVFVEFDAVRGKNQQLIKKLSLSGLFYYLDEFTSDANDDTFISGVSFQSEFAPTQPLGLVFNLTYYDYHNADGIAKAIGKGSLITPVGSSFLTPGVTTNLTPMGPVRVGGATVATLTNLGFASDFNILNPYFEVKTNGGDIPLKVFYDMVWNAGASGVGVPYDLGFRTGAKIGGTGKPGSSWVGYEFFYVEADATIDAFTEDSIGTNVMGHLLSGGVTFAKNVDLFATLNFFRNIEPQLAGFGDSLGKTIPGIIQPIDVTHWMMRPRVFLLVKF